MSVKRLTYLILKQLISLPLDSHSLHVYPLIAAFIKMCFNYLFVSQPFPLGLWVPWGQGF